MTGNNFSEMNQPPKIIRIALIGPESTGKSTLCEQLSAHYHTVWVEEFSRKFIAGLSRDYNENDVLFCIKKQIELEKEKLPQANVFFFTDNEAINGKVWMLDKYHYCPEWLEAEIQENPFDLYLLTYPDLPFIQDDVRENGDRRMYFYDWYKQLLDGYGFNYSIIKGIGKERFDEALRQVRKMKSVE